MTNPNHPFLAACRGEKTPYTPVWLMRQAGRYMEEYRKLRAEFGFLDLCKRPDLAAEITVTPVERLGVDAAIIFSDILLLLEPMGVGLEYGKGDGPLIHRPVRTGADVDRQPEFDPKDALPFVFEAIRRSCGALNGKVPLIGFSGAPFTLASYLIEGGGSRNYIHTKQLIYSDPRAWRALMERLSTAVAKYLNAQIAAGAEAVQIFDSWAGCLAPDDYQKYVLPSTKATISALTPGVPVIHFSTGTAGLLKLIRAAGGDLIGLDWRVNLDEGWECVGYDVGVQGNLDPVALLAPPDEIRRRVREILRRAGGRPGHIFNLGHGVLPNTAVEHVIAMVDAVHELSAR
ncbi:MAG: uroporphyrinogen decarboxylase [Deltaproteobacteria bacterium]|nr:uroporphyrinogen decarboxylase [Deltaproteobacteria bacterium]